MSASPDSIRESMLRAPADTWSGIVKLPLTIFFYRSLSLVPLNGKQPFNMAYRRTPQAQMSTGGPHYSFLSTISGAMQLGVPQNIRIFLSLGMQVEKPKSMSFTSWLESSSTFSNLISRCAMHLLWQQHNASITCLKMRLISGSSRRRLGLDLSNPCSDMPDTYSSIRLISFVVSIVSYNL